MAQIIAVANQKGGVGKTSTSVNIAAAMAAAEKKVLLIDFDPQGNATTAFGIDKTELEFTVYDILAKGCAPADLAHHPFPPFLDLWPATPDLSGAEVELATMERREFRLKEAVSACSADYDYIVIDCPPSLGLLTLNCLVAADSVLIPLQCEFLAMEGLTQLVRTIEITKKRLNPDLLLMGIVLTMFDKRNNLSHQVAEEVRGFFKEKVYKTIIPRNVRISEAPSFGKPVIWYEIRSTGAQAYLRLATEIMAGERS